MQRFPNALKRRVKWRAKQSEKYKYIKQFNDLYRFIKINQQEDPERGIISAWR
jgi:hypothetical protein